MTAASSAPFVVDEMWGKSCAAYHLQFRPDDDVIERIVRIQDDVEEHVDRLRRVPPQALHMTILTLVPPTIDKQAVARAWSTIETRCIEVAAALCATCGPLPVEWNTVRAYDKAIVLMGEAHPRLQQFRADVSARIGEPAILAPAPRIAHMTLFRYAAVDPRLAALVRPCGPISADMTEIRLVREDRYPSLELAQLRRWRLEPAM